MRKSTRRKHPCRGSRTPTPGASKNPVVSFPLTRDARRKARATNHKRARARLAGPREVSQAEREGLTSTDPNPEGPLSGVSMTKQGNERMYGSSEEAHRAEQMDIGVGGEPKNVDPDSPRMMTGDQGG